MNSIFFFFVKHFYRNPKAIIAASAVKVRNFMFGELLPLLLFKCETCRANALPPDFIFMSFYASNNLEKKYVNKYILFEHWNSIPNTTLLPTDKILSEICIPSPVRYRNSRTDPPLGQISRTNPIDKRGLRRHWPHSDRNKMVKYEYARLVLIFQHEYFLCIFSLLCKSDLYRIRWW